MRQLLIGTGNPGKFREITTILGELPWEFVSLNAFDPIPTPREEGDSYAANAIAKARYYAAQTGSYSLADDSGLAVEALGGEPGLFSARYAGVGAPDEERRKLLLSNLEKFPNRERVAQFVCAVAIAGPDQELLHVAEGICRGVIVQEPRGHSGFGYDPLFVPDGYDRTFAELAAHEKNQISHRARALSKTREFLLRSVS